MYIYITDKHQWSWKEPSSSFYKRVKLPEGIALLQSDLHTFMYALGYQEIG